MEAFSAQRGTPWARLLAGFWLALAGWPGAGLVAGEEAPLRVVATHSIVGEWTARVLGTREGLTVLAGANADLHQFEPRPSDVRALAAAEVIVENGLGLEAWLDRLVWASGSRARRVVLAEGKGDIALLVPAPGLLQGVANEPAPCPHCGGHHAPAETTAHDADHADHAPDGAHNPYVADPHLWLDAALAARLVRYLGEQLATVRPALAETLRANAAAYAAELEALDRELAAQLAQIPPARRLLITHHQAYGYFARRYGLTVPVTVINSTSTAHADPSARSLAEVIAAVRASGAAALFAERQHASPLVRTVAREVGLPVGLLYAESLDEPGTPGATYAGMLRANAAELLRLLR